MSAISQQQPEYDAWAALLAALGMVRWSERHLNVGRLPAAGQTLVPNGIQTTFLVENTVLPGNYLKRIRLVLDDPDIDTNGVHILTKIDAVDVTSPEAQDIEIFEYINAAGQYRSTLTPASVRVSWLHVDVATPYYVIELEFVNPSYVATDLRISIWNNSGGPLNINLRETRIWYMQVI